MEYTDYLMAGEIIKETEKSSQQLEIADLPAGGWPEIEWWKGIERTQEINIQC